MRGIRASWLLRAAVSPVALAVVPLWAAGCSDTPTTGRGARAFASPDEAVEVLVEAAETDDVEALQALFGHGAEEVLSSGDPVSDRWGRQVITVAFQQGWWLEETEPDTRTLVIGHEAWPFPVPLVRDREGWRFDLAAGREEILARRIGRNELGVIGICRTYVRAQEIYASRPHDDRPAGLDAQRIVSRDGKHDGLYWDPASGERPSPLGDLAAQAAVERDTRAPRESRGLSTATTSAS